MALDLKKLKSLFVVEDESAAKKEKLEAAAKKQAKPETGTVAQPSAPLSFGKDPGKATAKFMEVLHAAMQKQNLPGVDYLEYKQSLKSLGKMPVEEPVRYQPAYAMAQAMGATPQKLVESASHYLDVLKNEDAKFQQAVQNQRKEQIDTRQQAIGALEKVLQEKAARIKKLTGEMEQHRAEAAKLNAQIKDATAKVASTQASFRATYNSIVAQITADVENMKKYLK
jgi:lysyl-tRNA synthetase class I